MSSTDLTQLDPETKAQYKRRMQRDPWYYGKYVYGLPSSRIRLQRPLLYLYTRQAELLSACLSAPQYDGPVTDAVRDDLEQHGIDWTNPAHMKRMKRRMRRQNWRLPRSCGKSIVADIGDLWIATMDPDMTLSLGTKSDPYAWARIAAMGNIITSPVYGFWYPERVPKTPRFDVTMEAITLAGRTKMGVTEATIEGRGVNSPWTGRHYRWNRRDDIVGTESGDASLDDALKHMSNMTAIRDLSGWLADTYIGTINGENDDHSLLSADPDVMSIVVPMETHEGGTTLENVYSDGTLTMPEVFDRELVNDIKNESKINTEHGPIYLLQNYYMTAHKSGVSLFTRRMLQRSLFTWFDDTKSQRRLICRPKKAAKDKAPDKMTMADFFVLDTTKLPRSAFAWAADQSVTEDGSGDEWAIYLVCIDWEGVFYVLDGVKGRGYDAMVDELVPFDKKAGKPLKNGIDANATQIMTLDWLKRTPEFRDIARRIEGVKSNGEAKDVNIRNYIQARMLSGDLFVNPELTDWHREALRYRPRTASGAKRRRAIDNQLDATWMAMTKPRRPQSPEQIEDDEVLSEVSAYRQRTGSAVTVPSNNWFKEVYGHA
jgi:hypothetical protein